MSKIFELPKEADRRIISHALARCSLSLPENLFVTKIILEHAEDSHCISMIYWKSNKEKRITGEPLYISAGTIFDSKDGEYNSSVFRWKDIKSQPIKDIIEKYRDASWDTIHETIRKTGAGIRTILQPGVTPMDDIDPVLRIACTFSVIISWYEFKHLSHPHVGPMHAILGKLFEKNTNPVDRDADILKYWGVPAKKVMVGDVGTGLFSGAGVKITPLTYLEVRSPMDIIMPRWREILASECCSDVILNRQAIGFPMLISWTLLPNIHPDMFTNAAMRNKFTRSDRVKAVDDELRKTRGILWDIRKQDGDSYEYEEYDANIYDALKYSQKIIRQSGLAVIQLYENVGFTVGAAAPTAFRYTLDYHSRSPKEEYAPYAKIVQQLCITLQALHTLHYAVGATHNDLHYNNMCISSPYRHLGDHICFELVGGKNILKVPNVSTGYIIDYSRTIIFDHGTAARKLKEMHGESYMRISQRYQSKDILRLLAGRFPSIAEKQELIKGTILANFNDFAKVLALLDFLSVTKAYLARMVDYNKLLDNYNAKNPDNKITVKDIGKKDFHTVTSKIEEICNRDLTSCMTKIMSNKSIHDLVWPGEYIIQEAFPQYVVEMSDEEKRQIGPRLINTYNPSSYSFSNYDRYPQYLKDMYEGRYDGLEKTCTGTTISEIKKDVVYDHGYLMRESDRIKLELDIEDGYTTSTHSSWL